MVKYKLCFDKEKRNALVEIALDTKSGRSKRKKVQTLFGVFGVLFILIGVIGESTDFVDIFAIIVGAAFLAGVIFAKSFQRFVLKKAQKQADAYLNDEVAEYTFSDEGITINSRLGSGLTYWDAFREYGVSGRYIFAVREDMRVVFVDKTELTSDEVDEIMGLFRENIKG